MNATPPDTIIANPTTPQAKPGRADAPVKYHRNVTRSVMGANRRPGVLHVLHTLNRAGAEVLVDAMIRTMLPRYRFAVAVLDETGPLASEIRNLGIAVFELHRKPGTDLHCAAELATICHRQKIDIIHAHQYTPLFYSALAKMYCRMSLRRTPRLLFTEHGRHYPDHRSARRVMVNRLMINRLTDRMSAVGRFIAQALQNNEAMPAEKIQVIHNGIDTHRISDTAIDRDVLRQKLGVHDDQKMVLHVAGFRPVKDHTTALCGFAHALDHGFKGQLFFAGDGPTRLEAQQLATRLAIEDHVQFLGIRPDVDHLLHASDIVLLTSLSEGISIALIEAMAAGRPIVATDVGGNRELIDHGMTGLLAPRSDATGIGDHLLQLAEDDELRHRMGRAGQQRAHDCFDQKQMHDQYENIYAELAPQTA